MFAIAGLFGFSAVFPGLLFAAGFFSALSRGDLVVAAIAGAGWILISVPLVVSVLTSVVLVDSSLLVRIGVLGQRRYRQQILLSEISRALDGKVAWGRGGPVNGVEIELKTGERIELKVSYFLGSRRRRRWIDVINACVGDEPQRQPESITGSFHTQTAVGQAFWLQSLRFRRRAIGFVVACQAVVYVAAVGLVVRGLAVLVGGDLVGIASVFGGVVGLLLGVLLFAVVGKVVVQPKVRIDPIAGTIECGRFPIRTVLGFTEAEEMRLRAGIGGLRLEGPMTDATGIKKPHLSIYLGLTGLVRDDGTQHPLAEVMPGPLARLNDSVVITQRLEWRDATRLALFYGLGRLWHASSYSSCTDRLAR